MKTEIDIENWNRRDHFKFFNGFEEPFFGISTQLNASAAYESCKVTGHSFYLYYLHCTLQAINETENLRLRIQDEKVVLYDQIHASSTVLRADKTFDFSFMPYHADKTVFFENARKEIDRIQQTTGLNPGVAGDDVIHFSALPWINFSSISHARSFSHPDSCPKVSVGKLMPDGQMTFSLHAHHGLADGYHAALFFTRLQELLDRKEA